jgi:polyhydroxyalkanoate synthesis regulator phasin
MEYITFDQMIESGNVSKKQKQLLNLERFGLLPDNIASAINEERQLGNFPNPLTPVPQEEFEEFKNIMSMFVGDNVAKTDEDFAKIYYTLDRTKEFITDKDVLQEAGAITGGIVLPTVIGGSAGVATLPARVQAFIQKYPRYAKTLAAFFGGAGGSAPFSDSYLEALGYGAREAAGEGAFQVLHKYFPFLRKIFKGKDGEALEAGAKSSQKILSDAGSTITPARLSKSPTIDMIEQMAEVSFLGAGKLRQAGEEAVQVSQQQLGRFLNEAYFPGTAERNFVQSFMEKASLDNVDDLMKNFLLKGRDFYDTAINASYKNVNEIAKKYLRSNKIVDTNKLLSSFDRQIKIQGGDVNDPAVQALRTYIANFAETGKGGVDFLTAKNIRSHLLSKTNFYTTSGTTPPKYLNKIAGDMASYMTKLMDDSVKSAVKEGRLSKEQGKEILDAYKGANKLYKDGKETFNTKFVSQLLLDETAGQTSKTSLDAIDNIYKTITGAGDKPGRAREFFKLIDNGVSKGIITKEGADEIRKKIQGQYFYDVIRKSTEEGIINPKKVLDFIGGKAGPGTRVLNEMFYGSKDTLKGMEKYLNAMVLAQSRGIEKQKGSLAFISAQFGGAAAILGFTGFSPTGAAIGALTLGGPAVIAKLFTNKNFVDNLLNLEVAKSGTNKYARSLIQVVNSLVTNEFVDPILAKRFVDEAIVEDVFPEPDKALKQMKWYDGVKDTDLTSEESDNPGILEVQGKFNQAPPGLLEQLNIATLGSEPTTTAPVSEAPSMAPLDLGPITTVSAPPSQSINPNTLASLESVGLPFFQAKDGGLASIEPKKFKKPQVVS